MKKNKLFKPFYSKPYIELLGNYLVNLFCIYRKVQRFRPLITNFYVTKKCNLKCRYCYPPGDEPEMKVVHALSLLEKIRPHNPAINFTGGEPLLYKGLVHLLHKARELKFYPIILSTNGLLINRIKDVTGLFNHLIISLDSINFEVNDSISGVKGITERIIENIKNCADLSQNHGFHLSIHSVITPETIDGIEKMVTFCERLNITLSVSPEHGRYYPNSKLLKSKQYTRLINSLIKLKQKGKPIVCSYGYLRAIRDFSDHVCYSFLSPRVEPDGRVYFPCQRIKKRVVYLQNYQNLYRLMQKESSWIAGLDCHNRCFLACYIEVEQLIKNPFSILKEIPIKRWVFGQKAHQ